MMQSRTNWLAPLAAAGTLLMLAVVPASAAPAQSFGTLKPLALERSSDVQDIRHRRWHRHHCRLVKQCWIGRWGHRRCAWVRRCW